MQKDKNKKGGAPVTKKHAKDEKYAIEDLNELKIYNDERKLRLKKIHRRRRRMILIAAGLFAVLFLLSNWDAFAPQSVFYSVKDWISGFGRSKYPVTFDQGSLRSAVLMGNNIGVLTDTSFYIYSKSGGFITSRPHNIDNPQAVSGGGRAVIYGIGGKQFRVENRFGEPMLGTADFPITTAAAGADGSFAIVTQSDNYLSQLTLYDLGCKNVFKWYSSQGRILSCAVSPDGTEIAASVVGARNGGISSDIYLFNIGRKDPLAVVKNDGTLFFSVSFKSNDRVAAVGDNKTEIINQKGQILMSYPYEGRNLKCYANAQGPSVLVFEGYGDTSLAVSVNGNGKVQGQKTVNADIKYVAADSKGIVLSTRGGLWHSGVDLSGLKYSRISGDILNVLEFRGFVYVFGGQSVYQIKVS